MKVILLILGAVVAGVIVLLRLRPAATVPPPAESKAKKNGTKGVGGGGSSGTIGGGSAAPGLPIAGLEGTPAAPAAEPETWKKSGILISDLWKFSQGAYYDLVHSQGGEENLSDRELNKFERQQVNAYKESIKPPPPVKPPKPEKPPRRVRLR